MSSLRTILNRLRPYLLGSNPSRSQPPENVGEDYIFVHIPKNAGTSVAEALSMERTWHYTAQAYRKMVGDSSYCQRLSFAFVRNPWDRFLSLYHYARLEESRYHSARNPEDAPYGKHQDYDLLKDATLEECAQYLREGRLQHDDFINHWRPQSDWVTDDSGEVIVDFVGRVESIDDDFREIARHLGLSTDTLPTANTSRTSEDSYREALTDTARAIVGEYYREDIQRFGYNF